MRRPPGLTHQGKYAHPKVGGGLRTVRAWLDFAGTAGILVLESPEGWNKSSLFETIASTPWFQARNGRQASAYANGREMDW